MQHGRNLAVLNDYTPLQRERSEEPPMGVQQLGGCGRTVVFQVFNLRQVCD